MSCWSMDRLGRRYINTKPLNLHLVLKHVYYEQIEKGEKTVEYRDLNEYWRKRIFKKWNSNGRNIVTFHKGYSNETMTFQIKLLVRNTVSKQFELHLGERIEGLPPSHCSPYKPLIEEEE